MLQAGASCWLPAWIRSSRSTRGNRRRAAAAARASASGRCFSTRGSGAHRAERLREEAGEAIGRTAKNPTPTGPPQRRGNDAPLARLARSLPESRRRVASGEGRSEHPHLGLGTKHPLLIGGQDQGLFPRHVVRLGADVALTIEKQHPQQLAGGIKEMHRDDADRARAAEGSGGHGWAGE